MNLLTMDGFNGEDDYSISLEKIYTIHRVYELKRRKIQGLQEKTRKKLIGKYSSREENRVKDTLHKLAEKISNRTNIFEEHKNLKEKLLNYLTQHCLHNL